MSKNKNSKTVTAKKGAGRPRAIVTLPLTKKFTFPDICACNGCTPLTIRKWLKRDMFVTDSDGEYVLPADTVRKVGKGKLDKLRAQTHTKVR